MKKSVCIILFFICAGVGHGRDYINAAMLDIIQYERGVTKKEKMVQVLDAMRKCSDTEIKSLFFDSPYYLSTDSLGRHSFITADTLKIRKRLGNTAYIDINGDGEREVVFHERNTATHKLLAVILQKQPDQTYKAIFKSDGVFSNASFENRILLGISTCYFHNDSSPFDVFNVFVVKATRESIEFTQEYTLNVPYHFRYPVRCEYPGKPVSILTDTLFFYYKELYSPMDFPYSVKMKPEFEHSGNFNVHGMQWGDLTASLVNQSFLSENRGGFSSIGICINGSYAVAVPEYIFVYVPNRLIREK